MVTSGLYFKLMMIVNDNSRVVNKLEDTLTDDARVIIYDCHIFIVQATGRQVDQKEGKQKGRQKGRQTKQAGW